MAGKFWRSIAAFAAWACLSHQLPEIPQQQRTVALGTQRMIRSQPQRARQPETPVVSARIRNKRTTTPPDDEPQERLRQNREQRRRLDRERRRRGR